MQTTRWVAAAALLVACAGEPTAGPQPTNAPPATVGVEDTRPIYALRPEGEPLAAALRDLCAVLSRAVRPDGTLEPDAQSGADFEAVRERHEHVLEDLDRDPRMRGRPSYSVLVTVVRERGVAFSCPALETLLDTMAVGRPESLPRSNGNR